MLYCRATFAELRIGQRQQIALAEANVLELDGQIGELDDMVKAATKRGYTKSAMHPVGEQDARRAALVKEHQAAAGHLAELKVKRAGIDARRTRAASDEGPALYLAKLLGSTDSEAMVRLITLMIVLTLDPLAVLLTLAPARGKPAHS